MHFTADEFHTMVQELLYTSPSRFDMLCEMAQRTLTPMVAGWCRRDTTLCGRGLEEDVMQGILLHLMKKTVHGFLLNDRAEGAYNDDPEGFEHWMVLVAHNYQRDFANRLRREEFRTEEGEDALDGVAVSDDDWASREEQQDLLRTAFDVVLSSDMSVYKVLTWWAQVLFIADEGLRHHEANRAIVEEFQDKTLYEMYDYVLTVGRRYPWMTPSVEQHRRVVDALKKPRDEENTYGETPYRAFFMRKNGEISGSGSVSDWINRVKGLLGRSCGTGDAAPKSAAGKKKEGRG